MESGCYGVATSQISGTGGCARLKCEAGAHRLQRVPVTEGSGRIHTSAATVAVLPEADEVDLHIADRDLRADTYLSQGAGGQHVDTTDAAVRIHQPTAGVVVKGQVEKSKQRNRPNAQTVPPPTP